MVKIEYPQATVFQISGRLDGSSTPQLEKSVMNSLEGNNKNIIFDFSELQYINSAGLRILVMSYQRLQPLGRQVMVCGVRDYISEIFDISGYNRVFLMCRDVSQALHTCTVMKDEL